MVKSMNRQGALTFILITVVLDSMGIGLILPVMPELITEVRGSDIASAAVWGGILSAVFAIMQFLFGPLVGNLSDRYGRRPVLLISLAALALDYLIMAVAGTIWLLIIGRIIGGITSATHSTASAFMADISPPEKKAQNFGLISAAFGAGFVLGPIVGGLLGELGSRAPFYAAAALAAANFLLGYFVLPETVTPEKRRSFNLGRANPLGALRHIGKLPGVGWLLVVYFFYQISNMVYPAIWAYFTTAVFGWTSGMIGMSLAAYGIGMVVVQAGLIRVVIPKLGERRTVYLGLLYNVFVLILIGSLTNGWVLLVLTPVAAVGALVAPALTGIMSQRASDDQQGELQGVLTSINAIGMIVSPVMMTQAFFLFTREEAPIYLPGAGFFLAGFVMLLAFLAFTQSLRPHRTTEDAL